VIVLNLCCDKEHLFEGWFGSAGADDEQRDRGLVSCPVCGSVAVERRPTAPYVQTRAQAAPAAATAPKAETPAKAAMPAETVAAAMALAMLRRAARQAEDVGDRFADEARRMHHGEAEERSIRGQATRDDVAELLDEGIMVLPVPSDDADLH
jgi:hypothetical protein